MLDVVKKPDLTNIAQDKLLAIENLNRDLLLHYQNKLLVQSSLTRRLVSFQDNKDKAAYRWYKYKEAFSSSLVGYLLSQFGITSGSVLDPFAGIGTTLFTASSLGLDSDGIELLPIGQQVIDARMCLEREFTSADFRILQRWIEESPWKKSEKKRELARLRITDGAYPSETVNAIEHYMGAYQEENNRVQNILLFALLCVLESISYTRKDGQYLRWDNRSRRRPGGKPFDKGIILDFDQAINKKLTEILTDMKLYSERVKLSSDKKPGNINLFYGSCLEIMPLIPDSSYDAIVTSPPYCNRYDYTRTYALELALLGIGEEEISNLRQQMLSCTVENRAKDLLSLNPKWDSALSEADNQILLQQILSYLEEQKNQKKLNNNGIPRMVRGYFYEMACIIAECSRVLKANAPLIMVNDNVRYAGVSVSVDMILSSIAETLGFEVENILVLPKGKGNSSQQMGEHGRDSLRKCVYVWRKMSAEK